MSILFVKEINSNIINFIINNEDKIYNVIKEGNKVAIYDMFSNERVEDIVVVDYIKNRVH